MLFSFDLPKAILDFLEQGALKNPIWLGDSARKFLAMERQLAQSIVHTFFVENRRFNGDKRCLSLDKEYPEIFESVLPRSPGVESGLWIKNMGERGGVHAELECLRKPILKSVGIGETDNLFSIVVWQTFLRFSKLILSLSVFIRCYLNWQYFIWNLNVLRTIQRCSKQNLSIKT